MVPPSVTDGVAFKLTVVVSASSVIVVVAGDGSMTRFSKLPPVAELIASLALPPPI